MNTLDLAAASDTANLGRITSEARGTFDDGQLGAVTGGIVRSVPNGRTDVIKAMGNTKWSDVELDPSKR